MLIADALESPPPAAPLSARCHEMLVLVKVVEECRRYVKGDRKLRWQVGGHYFHEFTGDALVNRGLLEHFVREHDGSAFDRYRLTINA